LEELERKAGLLPYHSTLRFQLRHHRQRHHTKYKDMEASALAEDMLDMKVQNFRQHILVGQELAAMPRLAQSQNYYFHHYQIHQQHPRMGTE
jgi:hypothetical protein